MKQTHPLLESDVLTCPHNGVVQLKSLCGDLLEVEGAGVITESDLLNSPIIGCTKTTAGIPTPCTLVTMIPLSAISSLLEVNDSGVILQSQIPTIKTDKGFPLTLTNKTPNNIVFLDEEDNQAKEREAITESSAETNMQEKQGESQDKSKKEQEDENSAQAYDEAFQILDSNEKPLASVRYKITLQDGAEIFGVTDKNGYTQRIATPQEEILHIEILG